MIFRHNRLALCCALLLAGSIPTAQAGPREDALAALMRGEAALGRGDARTARVELLNAIKVDPALGQARVAQARALLMLGDSAGAQMELKRAQALGVAPGALRPWLAQAALIEGRAEDALNQARARDADARHGVLLMRFEGQALQALGRHAEAAAVFSGALARAPNDAAVWTDIARLNIATGDIATAIAAADRATALAPDSADALTLRGVLARDQYGLRASLAWFDRALKNKPDHVPALIEYAASLLDMARASQALSLTRRALAVLPGQPRALFLQALIAARAGRHDLARALLARTGGALDGQAAVRLLRGVLHLHAGNATLAVGELRPLVDAQPFNLRARLLLSRALYDDRQYAKAERVLSPIVERGDAGGYALTLAARIHEALGERMAAALFLARAAAMAPAPSAEYRGAGRPDDLITQADADPSAATNLRLIRKLMEAGQGQAALARARSLAVAKPGAPEALIALGDCLLASGPPEDAAIAYARAANLRFDENTALRLVDAWRRAGQEDKARQALGLFAVQNPMNVEAQRLLGQLLLAAGEYRRALRLLSGLRNRIGNEDALLMADIAHAYVGLGKAGEALPFAAHAYRLMPASAVASDALGWTLFRARGADSRAIELLRKAETYAPGEPLVKLHLGQTLAASGKTGEARVLLRQAAMAPGFARRGEAQAALNAL